VSNTITRAELEAKLAAMEAENNALKAKQQARQQISFKVSEKGAVSIYGLNARFPVTLYRGQMERLLDKAPEIRAFIAANSSRLATKPTKE
jgi:hypothetical protein